MLLLQCPRLDVTVRIAQRAGGVQYEGSVDTTDRPMLSMAAALISPFVEPGVKSGNGGLNPTQSLLRFSVLLILVFDQHIMDRTDPPLTAGCIGSVAQSLTTNPVPRDPASPTTYPPMRWPTNSRMRRRLLQTPEYATIFGGGRNPVPAL